MFAAKEVSLTIEIIELPSAGKAVLKA